MTSGRRDQSSSSGRRTGPSICASPGLHPGLLDDLDAADLPCACRPSSWRERRHGYRVRLWRRLRDIQRGDVGAGPPTRTWHRADSHTPARCARARMSDGQHPSPRRWPSGFTRPWGSATSVGSSSTSHPRRETRIPSNRRDGAVAARQSRRRRSKQVAGAGRVVLQLRRPSRSRGGGRSPVPGNRGS